MTMFVLPLNSAINPMLYTFSTGKIRIKMFKKIFNSNSTETRNRGLNQESIGRNFFIYENVVLCLDLSFDEFLEARLIDA